VRLHIETPEAMLADRKIIDHDVERRQFLERLARFWSFCSPAPGGAIS
jgi:hypothetical protein